MALLPEVGKFFLLKISRCSVALCIAANRFIYCSIDVSLNALAYLLQYKLMTSASYYYLLLLLLLLIITYLCYFLCPHHLHCCNYHTWLASLTSLVYHLLASHHSVAFVRSLLANRNLYNCSDSFVQFFGATVKSLCNYLVPQLKACFAIVFAQQ